MQLGATPFLSIFFDQKKFTHRVENRIAKRPKTYVYLNCLIDITWTENGTIVSHGNSI